MQTLRMLGSIGLIRSDGTDVDALLRQPKSVALLAYLAVPRPGTWHRRDLLLATFWPELSQPRARAALRSALHLLRRHLEPDTIRTRGDDEVSLDPDRITSDVAALLDAVAGRARSEALANYGGALLPGLYVDGTPEFERWLETERAHLADLAVKTANSLVDERAQAGDFAAATDAARRAAELSPDDERVVRRLITLLGRIGDRAQALALFERFRTRLAAEFGAEPSPETVALVERLRIRTTSSDTTGGPPVPLPHEVIASPLADVETHEAPSGTRVEPPMAVAPAPRTTSLIALAVFGTAIVVATVYVSLRRPVPANATASAAVANAHRLILLPVRMAAGDTSNGYLASGLTSGIARRLERLGALRLRTGSPAEWPASPTRETGALTAFGPTVVLRLDVATVGDSLDVRAAIADSASGRVRSALARRFARLDIAEIESEIAAAVAASTHRVSAPFDPRGVKHPAVDAESYRLTILGFHQLLVLRDNSGASVSFVRATELDPLNVRAWAGLSSTWASRTVGDQVPFEEGFEQVSTAAERALAIDSTDGTALANLGIMRALERHDVSAGMPLIRRAIAYESSNAEIFLIASFLNHYAHRWDESRDLIRTARDLDPLTPRYAESEGTLEMCANKPEASEQVFRRVLEQRPRSAFTRNGLIRALAAQRRYDEALDIWRGGIDSTLPTTVAKSLRDARGRAGYWAAVHAQGRARLDTVRRDSRDRRASLLRLIDSQFRSGDTTTGFAMLDAARREHAVWLYRLPCFEWLDEVRDTPRYRAILSDIGAMPVH